MNDGWVERLRRSRELPGRVAGLRRSWQRNLLLPAPDVYAFDASEPFPAGSTPSVRDFLHPRFQELRAVVGGPSDYHRKLWEWVFILHTGLERTSAPGGRALGFGVGASEPIAAGLARFGMQVTATDAPEQIGAKWSDDAQYAATAADILHAGIVDDETFSERVRYERCDMTSIADDFRDYDFAWSSSCLEHLGNIRNGLDFIVESVERTLKVGGVACHTTELNLTSNDETVETGNTVVYRKRDLDELVTRLVDNGHRVDAISVAPGSSPLDWWVDTPPYSLNPHLKLEFNGFAITSVAIVVERGR